MFNKYIKRHHESKIKIYLATMCTRKKKQDN